MRVFNKKYWPHQILIEDRRDSIYELEHWCYDNFASRNWRNVGYYFVFKNGSEATAFALKWL